MMQTAEPVSEHAKVLHLPMSLCPFHLHWSTIHMNNVHSTVYWFIVMSRTLLHIFLSTGVLW